MANNVKVQYAFSCNYVNQNPSVHKLGDCISVEGTERDCDGPIVYTDGACSMVGQYGRGRCGIGVFWGPGHPDNVCELFYGFHTPNRAEIKAAIRAIQQAKRNGFREMCIRTDSLFLIKCATQWIHPSNKSQWELKGEPNWIFEDLIKVCEGMKKIVWQKVPAHSGNFGNDQADLLAKYGKRKRVAEIEIVTLDDDVSEGGRAAKRARLDKTIVIDDDDDDDDDDDEDKENQSAPKRREIEVITLD